MKKLLTLSVILFPLLVFSQWQATKSPYGGNVLAFYEYNNTLYAGTSVGLFASTNDGDNWKFIDVGYPISASAITQMGGRIFVGTSSQGIYCSSDNGISWKTVNTGLSTNYRFCVFCIKGFSVMGNKIFAGTGFGLYKLENNDTTWTNIPDGGYFNDAFSGNGSIIVTSERARYGPGSSSKITTDGGLTFRNISFPDTLSYLRDFAYSWDISSNGLFAVTSYDLYFSADSGVTWTSLYHDTADYRPTVVKVIDDKIYLATYAKGLLVSSVNNISWTNDGLQNMNVGTLYKSNQTIFAGMGYIRGIFAKTNGSNWIEKNNGLSAMNISSIESSDNVIVAGCKGGVMISVDTGYTWVRHDLRLPGKPYDKDNDFNIEEIATNGKIILAGTDMFFNTVFFSLDSGNTWSVINQSFNLVLSGLAIIGNRFIVCAWYEFYYSDDYGQSWQAGQLPSGNYLWNGMSSNSKELFLIGYGQGGMGYISTSKDSGVTWNTVPRPSGINIAFLQATDSLLFVQDLSTGLFVGSTNGNNWYNSDTIPFGNPTIGIKGNDVFISDRSRVPSFMHSPDLGHTWNQELLFGNHKVEQLGSSKYFAFASVPGFGIWRYGAPNSTSIFVNSEIFPNPSSKDSSATLVNSVSNPSGNIEIYPNPSSKDFHIKLFLAGKHNPYLKIYNVNGEIVYFESLIESEGEINKKLELKERAGIYFVEMTFGNERRSKKIILE